MFQKIVGTALLLLLLRPCYGQACLDTLARIPSGPSTRYALELLVSIPDTTHPRSLFSLPRGRLGHVFLGLCKAEGDRKAVAYLGFYARSPLLAFGTGLPVPSRMADNARHAYNAGIVTTLTGAQFDTVLARLQRDGRRKYSIFRYNCVHYALDVFNATRAQPLTPSLLRLGTWDRRGYLTPNSVYLLLSAMRSGPEKQNVILRSGRASAGEDPLLERAPPPDSSAAILPYL
jgi:hypothetical protein